ncbi:aldose epimerase family protein [Labilibaculum euxinus]
MKLLNVLCVVIIPVMMSCQKPQKKELISETDFSCDYNGKKVELFTLTNKNGLVCQLTNFGARVVSLWVPDKNGNFADVAVGYGTGKDFIDKKEYFFGGTIGRYGNRIGQAKFSLDGIEYQLEANNGENHLHGGSNGFYRQIWDVNQIDKQTLEFSLHSADMDGGYPGNVDVKVKYQFTDDNELKIEYFGTTDKLTVLNFTNHTYFNLKGAGAGTINDHQLMINADSFTPVDAGLIPTGEILPVKGTAFDFNNLTAIGERVDNDETQLTYGKGYDHNWVLNKSDEKLTLAAKVVEPSSGRILEVYTIEPGIQFYGGNFLDGVVGKGNKKYDFRTAFCLETQHFPDSPNQANFPDVTVKPGEEYYSICIYKFSSK